MTTLRQLKFLAALDETRNFSNAAARCNVTQSTLSTGVKELEARLGMTVAERSTHGVMMTPLGAELAERARAILSQVQDFETLATRDAAGPASLRLGTIPTVGPYLMPAAMPLLRKALPDTKLYLREELTDPLVEKLLDGRLDLLLIALPHDLPPSVETEVLFTDGYALATPQNHPLGNRDRVGADDLAGRDLLLLEKGHCLQRHALSSLPGIGLGEDESFAATSLSTLVAMVEEDLGITLLPDLAVDGGLARGHALHLGDVPEACPRQVVLAWRKSAPDAALFREIGTCLREARDALAAHPRSTGP